jgi:hypothetical protein
MSFPHTSKKMIAKIIITIIIYFSKHYCKDKTKKIFLLSPKKRKKKSPENHIFIFEGLIFQVTAKEECGAGSVT